MLGRRLLLLTVSLMWMWSIHDLGGGRAYGLERVIIHAPSRSLTAFPAVVAQERGFFKEENLAPQVVYMSASLGVKALVAAEVDYSVAFEFAVRAAVGGAPTKGVLAWNVKPLHLLISRPEIKSVRELKGKVIGVGALGGTMEMETRMIARHYGLDPDKDIQLIALADEVRFPALKAGSVAASILGVPWNTLAKKQGYNILANPGDIVERPLAGLATTERKIREHPDQIKRVVRAAIRGMRYMRGQQEAGIRMVMDWLKLDREVSEAAYEMALQSLSRDGIAADQGVQSLIDLQKANLSLKKEVPLTQVVDWRFAREANADLKP